jgi:hypothetical protein
MNIDISLICSRRPDLLEQTLESFQKMVFVNFEISSVIVNLDPIFGSKEDEGKCIKILKTYFKDPIIILPSSPNFGQAVKSVWSKISSDIVLHMEDDWIANEKITEAKVLKELDSDKVASLVLSSETTATRLEIFRKKCTKNTLANFFGYKRCFYSFGTSPQFIRGIFAKRCSSLINIDLDPEKQMTRKYNVELFRYQQNFKSKNLWGDGGFLIKDIGRVWREDRDIKKNKDGPRTYWSNC